MKELKIILQNGSPLKKGFRYSDEELGIKEIEEIPIIESLELITN